MICPRIEFSAHTEVVEIPSQAVVEHTRTVRWMDCDDVIETTYQESLYLSRYQELVSPVPEIEIIA